MRHVAIGVLTLFIFTAAFLMFIFGIAFYQDYSTKQCVSQYYDSLIEGNYTDAFEHVHIWSEDPEKNVTIADEQAREIFLKDVSALKEKGYKILKVNKIDVVEDEKNLGAKIELTVKIDGRMKQVKEKVVFYDTRIVIEESQDPYAKYRDGKINT